jgi:DNA-binding response OmpR family regulator
MVRKVLIVDDDREMLLSLKEGLGAYLNTFSVEMALDGLAAMDKLKEEMISLVITDLKMPRMDGFSLLSHIMEAYPDIPVMIITGYGTPNTEKMAKKGGAAAFIEKPFMIDDLARRILDTLRRESEGGTLHGVSSGMFLQLIEMEQKTCTIRLTNKFTGKQGILFFLEGELLDARINGLQGESAALEIFSWDQVTLSIQNDCAIIKRKIQSDLQAVLLEAMRLKDEAGETEHPEEIPRQEEKQNPSSPDAEEESRTFERIRNLLSRTIGEKCGLQDISGTDDWDGLLAQMARVGSFLGTGKLRLVYVDRGEPTDFILLPGPSTYVLSVNAKCPRDRMTQELLGE